MSGLTARVARFAAWDVDNEARARRLPFYGRTHTPLDIALMRSGRAREDECEAALVAAGGRCVTTTTRDAMGALCKTSWSTASAALATAHQGELVYGREVLIEGSIGAFDVGGAIDFVVLMWDGPRPLLRLVECKAARRDRTYQRIQVAVYGLLVRAALAALPLVVAGVRLAPTAVQCVVARIEEATNTLGDLLTLPPLDLTVEEDDIARLLAPDGRLCHIYASDEDALEYQLDPKCDTCTYSAPCLAEAARKRQVQLIGCSTTTTRILRAAGVSTLNALADLDLAGATATRIRRDLDFTEDLAVLQRRAQVRRTTLPGGKRALPVLPGSSAQPAHEVELLPTRPLSQLPAHDVAAPEPLVRVFLEVSYDYVEDRVAAVAAHITASPHQLVTPFVATTDPATGDARWMPAPEVREERLIRVERMPDTGRVGPTGDLRGAPGAMYGAGDDDLVAADRAFADAYAAWRAQRAAAEGPHVYFRHRTRAEGHDLTDLVGREVVALMERAWTRNGPVDTCAEATLLEGFFVDLAAAIQEEAGGPIARVHLYIWSRAEMAHLVAACRRCGSRLLQHLYQLLGCREPLEQLIFSCLQEEVTGRYALGWTGSGLGLAASLSWFGQRYHWTRRLDGEPVALDRAFRAGVFDFADRLVTNPDGTWAKEETVADGRTAHVYEIHARHYDTLPLPYLHSFWGILTAEDGMHGIQVQAIHRYSAAAQPGYLRAYLRARVHALRWIEDRIGELGRNSQIVKRPLELAQLSAFDLDASGVARANRDFMRLEHHISLGQWLSERMGPPGERLPAGRTIPVKRVRAIAENTVAAELNLSAYGLTAADLEPVCTIGVGDWVRLAPCDARRDAPQTYGQLTTGGKTGIVRALDWAAGLMVIDVLWQPEATRYRLQSAGVTRRDAEDGVIVYSFATVDESPSDYVADRVEAALGQGAPTPIYAWFDHTAQPSRRWRRSPRTSAPRAPPSCVAYPSPADHVWTRSRSRRRWPGRRPACCSCRGRRAPGKPSPRRPPSSARP